MGILDELRPKETHADRFWAWLAQQPKKDQEEWRTALADSAKYSAGAISRALKARGLELDENAVYAIRKKMR